MISKLANSSLGESRGCVSDVPLSCLISISGSLRIARRGIGGVDRAALGVDLGRDIRPSERLALCEMASSSLPALRWPSIQFQRSTGMVGVQGAEGRRRNVRALLEEDVAVEVHVVRHRGPLVRAERRELSRLVRLVGELDVLLPDRAGDLRRHQRLDRRPGNERIDGVQRDPLHLLLRPGFQNEGLRLGILLTGRLRVVGQLDDAGVFGVVRDARAVERRVDLDVVPERMLDRLALEVLVRIARSRSGCSRWQRVERPARVDVRLAEVGVAVRIGLGEGRRGPQKTKRGAKQTPARPKGLERMEILLIGDSEVLHQDQITMSSKGQGASPLAQRISPPSPSERTPTPRAPTPTPWKPAPTPPPTPIQSMNSADCPPAAGSLPLMSL